MKMTRMYVTVLGCAVMFGTGLAGAQSTCNGSGMGKMDAKAGQDASAQDKQFMQMASMANYTEITFSQLAEQKAQSPKVKAFAQRMISDHTALSSQMKPVAEQAGVTPATSLDAEHQEKYDQLNQLSGAEFDKTYMQDMVMDHQKAVEAFKTEESSTQDKALKPMVKHGEKVVAEHLQMADKLTKTMGGTASGM